MYGIKLNETFILRMKAQGRDPFPPVDGDDASSETQKKGKTRDLAQGQRRNTEPWTHDKAERQEYQALLNEGISLYKRNEYTRAIEALTKAYDQGVEGVNNNILIDRADCYIQVGKPELAIEDVNRVLNDDKNNPRAILTKAEAYFSMGEFEFALVFFQRGMAIRKDMIGFKDGVTKAKHAILDSIDNKEVYQPNPNYASCRTRKPLVDTTQARALPKDDEEQPQENEKKENQKDPTKLLPEKVAPLVATEEKENYLGELSLDYQFLTELQTELASPRVNTTEERKKENNEISEIVGEALEYLDQRGSFWSQQGSKKSSQSQQSSEAGTARSVKSRSAPERTPKQTKSPAKGTPPFHQMSKIQQYEYKHPYQK